jgi:uncharacterized protein YhfF/uncharacterized cupin superfamily protein
MTRPSFLIDGFAVEEDDEGYPGDPERMAFGRAIGKAAGLERLGVHLVRVPPGRRTSYPHAEGDEEEFVYVIGGEIDAWIDGALHRMRAGDFAAFPAGTGISHAFLNNGSREALLLVGGERSVPGHRLYYPLNPERKLTMSPEEWWTDVPARPLGPHDGRAGSRLGRAGRAWADELIAAGEAIDLARVEQWSFGDSAELANELVELVVHGTKRGTAGSLWAYEHDRLPVPVVGGRSIVTRFDGTPVCLIETTAVAIEPFRDVGEEFAASEGEGDLSLAYWRRVHEEYFTRECATIGRVFSDEMPVVCESFALVRVR